MPTTNEAPRPADQYYTVRSVDDRMATIDAQLTGNDGDYDTRLRLRLERDNLERTRDRVAANLERVTGPEIADDAIDQLYKRHREYAADQARVAAQRRAQRKSPDARIDTDAKVSREPAIPEDITTPPRYQEWLAMLNEAAFRTDDAYKQQWVGETIARAVQEAAERGLDVDPARWLYEIDNPRDRWPEGNPDLLKWDAEVIAGKRSADEIPYLDVAWRGELAFQDYLHWAGQVKRIGDLVEPQLERIINTALYKGLIVEVADPPVGGPRYRLAKTGDALEIPEHISTGVQRPWQPA